MTEGKPLHLLTPAELRARYGTAPPPRPLTPQETEDLRRRLNADGDLALTPDEHRAYYQLGVVRYAQDVDALVARVSAEALDTAPASPARSYAAGILDAVAWARGERREAPVTGAHPRARLPSTGEMQREAADAAEVLEGRARSGHPRGYISGVECTLLWLVCSGNAHPWTS
ncbi:hypothetical protein ACOQFV_24385 [Nocardiopsis changdeensis]|uniref:Uncharacterized protein n=1 Tax=Nocardiopsis changdeensis TaxID=2831969 RepID=A0A975QCN1_9ACTN|nr:MULTISPECIES: hypothetical protein [Nocardiopsis]QUX26470.1 hypothetical protein KGD84_32750 [Nocardiopsis changdeensis]QYX40742.1 hypothetical protein K1J57_32600 [Nocardiopsis sp. MT53]